MAIEIVERFAEGKGDNDLKILIAFIVSEDLPTRVAISGALAMMAAYEEVAIRIVTIENFQKIFDCLDEETEPGVEHRLASLCRHLCSACRASAEELPWPKEERRCKGKDGSFTKADFEEKYSSS